MTGDFVPAPVDVPHQGGAFAGDPAEHEKGGPHAALAEHLQHQAGVLLHPERVALPVGHGHAPLEGRYLEVVLDVYGERVDGAQKTFLSSTMPRFTSTDPALSPGSSR